MSPIIMLDELVTPTAVFVGITRSKRSRNCLIMPSDNFDFGVFGRGKLLNEKNELLLAHLRGDADFEKNLAEYHRCRKAKKPKADAARVSSARALAGENGDRKRKREGGENGDRDRKGGDRAQQQAAGREGGRAGDVDVKRAARESSGLTRSAAARRLHGHDDDAVISPTTSIPGRASVRDRIDRAKGMAVRQAIQLKLYTTRSLKRDETAGCIRLVRASGENDPDTVMCDAECDGLENDRSPMESDTYVRNPIDDFSD